MGTAAMTNAERCRAYYERNKASRIAKQQEYYAEHREERLAYAVQYQQEHQDAHRQATERHRRKDPTATKKYNREYTAARRERIREQKRADYQRRKEWQAEYNREQRKPEAVRARWRVANALRSGALAKPEVCSRCEAETPSRRLHAHHHRGYDSPLDVTWLCTICHGVEHRKD